MTTIIMNTLGLHTLSMMPLNIFNSNTLQLALWIVLGIVVLLIVSWLYDCYVTRKERKRQAKEDSDLYWHTRSNYDDYYIPEKSEDYRDEVRYLRANGGQPLRSLNHRSVRLVNLPFVPYRGEVIYVENKYQVAANRYVRENMNMIRKYVESHGFSFVYLPDVRPTKEMVRNTLECMMPEGVDPEVMQRLDATKVGTLKSTFLLDFMHNPDHRDMFPSGFAWYNRSEADDDGRSTYIYDVITFDGEEALHHPEWMMKKVCLHLGHSKGHTEFAAVYCMKKENPAEASFETEATKLLESVRAQLEKARLMGVSEALIAQYVVPSINPSRMTITHDLRIWLNDWNCEVVMEPLNKAVYLLFLRHPEGIMFKCLSDYRHELNAIYQAVKTHKNDIDNRMKHRNVLSIVPKGVVNTTNPLHNAINEKCARIREAFLLAVHESVVDLYAVTGQSGEPKGIRLSRSMVTWEKHDE